MTNATTEETRLQLEAEMDLTQPSTPHAFRPSLAVFFASLCIYLITWGGHYTSGDGAHKVAWARAILFGNDAAGMTPDSNGLYSKYGIGHSLIAMLPLTLSHIIQQHTGIHCEAALYTLVFVVNGALLVALIAFYLFHFHPPKRVWLTVALIALASTWWPYTKMDFSEALVATVFFAGFVLMRFGRPFLGMAIAALIITIRTDGALLIALLLAWSLYKQASIKILLKLSLAALPALLIIFAGNYIRYASLFDHGYSDERFSTPLLLGLYGILFSAGKSIFLFSPPLILGFLGWKRFHQQAATRNDALLFISVFLAQLFLYAKWWDWSSDDAWGVRFMLPGVVFMCIPAAEVLHHRLLTVGVALAGISIQILAVTVGGLNYLMLIRTENAQRQALYVTGSDRIDFEDIRYNPRYSQIMGNWILFRHLIHLPPAQSSESVGRNGTPLYDSLTSQTWSQSAQWDFFWARK